MFKHKYSILLILVIIIGASIFYSCKRENFTQKTIQGNKLTSKQNSVTIESGENDLQKIENENISSGYYNEKENYSNNLNNTKSEILHRKFSSLTPLEVRKEYLNKENSEYESIFQEFKEEGFSFTIVEPNAQNLYNQEKSGKTYYINKRSGNKLEMTGMLVDLNYDRFTQILYLFFDDPFEKGNFILIIDIKNDTIIEEIPTRSFYGDKFVWLFNTSSNFVLKSFTTGKEIEFSTPISHLNHSTEYNHFFLHNVSLVNYNSYLEEIWKVDLGEDFALQSYSFNKETDSGLIYSTKNRLIKVDLSSGAILETYFIPQNELIIQMKEASGGKTVLLTVNIYNSDKKLYTLTKGEYFKRNISKELNQITFINDDKVWLSSKNSNTETIVYSLN